MSSPHPESSPSVSGARHREGQCRHPSQSHTATGTESIVNQAEGCHADPLTQSLPGEAGCVPPTSMHPSIPIKPGITLCQGGDTAHGPAAWSSLSVPAVESRGGGGWGRLPQTVPGWGGSSCPSSGCGAGGEPGANILRTFGKSPIAGDGKATGKPEALPSHPHASVYPT